MSDTRKNGGGISHGITPQPSTEGASRNTPQSNDGLANAASTRPIGLQWAVGVTLTEAHVTEAADLVRELERRGSYAKLSKGLLDRALSFVGSHRDTINGPFCDALCADIRAALAKNPDHLAAAGDSRNVVSTVVGGEAHRATEGEGRLTPNADSDVSGPSPDRASDRSLAVNSAPWPSAHPQCHPTSISCISCSRAGGPTLCRGDVSKGAVNVTDTRREGT